MSRPTNFSELVSLFIDMIELAIPLLFGITLLYITWKVIDAWIIHGDGSQVEEGKNTVIVGVIALVVMSGIWGILAILQSSLFN
jgi:hypothetical protein